MYACAIPQSSSSSHCSEVWYSRNKILALRIVPSFASNNQKCRITKRTTRLELGSPAAQPLNVVVLDPAPTVSANSVVEKSCKEESLEKETELPFLLDIKSAEHVLAITVVGASGTLARTTIFPALFSLFFHHRLPESFFVLGFARTFMTDNQFRTMIRADLTCRIHDREDCAEEVKWFLSRCFYHHGHYSSEEHFLKLDEKLEDKLVGRRSNRLFYLAIPPQVFVDVVRSVTNSTFSHNYGWTRFIFEKPFGHDLESSIDLTRRLTRYLDEKQIFRIVHHLGKELVDNLLVLRFSNLVFEPLWCRTYIRNVQFILCEDFGTEGRRSRSKLEKYEIIRDVIQTHLLQILTLFAMETPISLDAEHIRNEKVKVLRSIRPVKLTDVVVGQCKEPNGCYASHHAHAGEPSLSNNAVAATFAAATLFIDNARWEGVPFLVMAERALRTKCAEIRVQFRHVPGNLYKHYFGTDLDKATNELVIRVQPEEAIYLKINSKLPGYQMRLDVTDLNMLYEPRYARQIPNAYERLLLDAIEGEGRLFIRSDELDAAWRIFTPLLKELEEGNVAPELYQSESSGPVGVHYLAGKHGIRWEGLDPFS